MAALKLTHKQRQIVERLTAGYDTKHLVKVLCIAPATLRSHLRAIFSTLGVSSRVELVAVVLTRILRDVDADDLPVVRSVALRDVERGVS